MSRDRCAFYRWSKGGLLTRVHAKNFRLEPTYNDSQFD